METRKKLIRKTKPLLVAFAAALVVLPALVALDAPASAAAAATTTEEGGAFATCKTRHPGERPGTWQPAPQTAGWQWQLQGKIRTDVPACVYDVDGFEVSKGTVATLHRKGVKAICYLDVGSWEEYRPDAGQFPKSSLGDRYEGWPEERWLDVAHFHKFAPIMEHRIAMCAHKGFDAVEPDNIAGYENKTGFQISAADQLRYNRWLARQVHRRGMTIALKNDPGQAKQLVHLYDFAIVEECFQYHECNAFEPFVKAGKAVFETEYELPPAKFCGQAKELGFSAIRKGLELFAKPWEPCERVG